MPTVADQTYHSVRVRPIPCECQSITHVRGPVYVLRVCIRSDFVDFVARAVFVCVSAVSTAKVKQ